MRENGAGGEQRPGLRQAVVALQYRDFRLLFLSALVSGFGGNLQGAANMWQIFELTGSPLHLGLTGLARAIPIICFSLAGGVVADRVDRRKILMFTQGMGGVFAVILAVLSLTGLIQVWHIYALTFVSAAVMSASAPARDAIIANLVPRQHLMNAVALHGNLHQVSRIIGPSIAGLFIATIGLSITYALNGITHLITFVILGRIYLGPRPVRPRGNVWQNMVEGLSFVRYRSIILVLLATDAAAMLFGSFNALLPLLSDRHDAGATGFGLLSSATAIGAVVGATIVASMGDIRYKGYLIVGSILAYSASLVGLALSPFFVFTWVFCALLGLTDALQATPRNAVIQLITPDHLRGRVSSFRHMLVTGMPSLGQGAMGGAAGLLTIPVALILGAAICAMINVGLLASRRDLRARDLGAEAPEAAPPREPARREPVGAPSR